VLADLLARHFVIEHEDLLISVVTRPPAKGQAPALTRPARSAVPTVV